MPTPWSSEDLAVLGAAPSLHLIAGADPLLSATGRRSAEVGMVVVDGQLYVRAYAGHLSGWLQLALAQRRGRIRTGTIDSAVRFSRYEGPTDTIDEAYRAKYGHHGGLVTHPRTKEATLRVEPAG